MPVWEKLGQLYDPTVRDKRHPKLITHCANPLAVPLEGDVFRVFYSGRDANKRSSVGAVDINIATRQIVQDHHAPFFEHGPLGSFYADGVSIGNCYRAADGRDYILFMAWQVPPDAHWRGDVGRLRLTEAKTLELADPTPHLSSDEIDPVSLSYPWVQPMPQGGYEMWYGSTITWDAGNGEMEHVFNHATSPDGHTWQKHGQAVPSPVGVAQAFSRPTVATRADGGLEMWFSYRGPPGRTYRIGYARAEDRAAWILDLDASGIDVSPSGWDSDMIEYPFIFDHGGERYMLYNGNGFGATGFGLAVLRQG
ncbi:MAG: hypothetical protein AAF231_15030 [Pseudomonadota bacterium]